MKFLSNTYDPNRTDARDHVQQLSDETQEEAWRNYRHWLRGKVIGDPQPTKRHSVAELRAMGMVGVYALEGEDA